MRTRTILLLVVAALLGGILTYLLYDPSHRYTVEQVSFVNKRGDRAEGMLFLPISAAPGRSGGSETVRCPAVLSVHYGLQNREALQPTASFLAEQGIAVLELVLKANKPNGASKSFDDYTADTKAAGEFLLNHPAVDPKNVYLSGHSIGGNLAAMVGSTMDEIAGIIPVGYPVEISPSVRQDVLIISGVYDELHQPSKMMAAFNQTRDAKNISWLAFSPEQVSSFPIPATGEMTIDPARGNRVLQFSFLSDHYLEPTDLDAAHGIAQFILVRASEGGKYPGWAQRVKYRLKLLARILFFLGLVFLFVYFFAWMQVKIIPKKKIPPTLGKRLGGMVFLIVFGLVALVHRPSEHLLDVTALSALLLAVIAFNHFTRKMERRKTEFGEDAGDLMRQFEQDASKVLMFFGITYGAFTVGLYLHAGWYAYAAPDRFFRTLLGVLYMVFGHMYVGLTRLNGLFLNADWTFRALPVVLLVIVGAELAYPGGIGRILDEFFTRILKQLRDLDFRIRWQASLPSVILLVVLIIAGIFVWRNILAEGYAVGFQEVLGLIYLFFCFIIVPAVLVTLAVRWNRTKRLLARFTYQGETENA